MARKFCLFCGRPPSLKNKEHVLPIWLIELTGERHRRAQFGPDWHNQPATREYAFDQFHFPACKACNDRFGKLERHTAPIMRALLAGEGVAAPSITTLLDWCDKVRIGLWLGMSLLDSNVAGVTPRFHIADRVGQQDRLLAIYRRSPVRGRLGVSGVVGPLFQCAPSAFILKVDDLVFLNASAPQLCSRALGFPFLEDITYTGDGVHCAGVPRHGSEVVVDPVCPPLRVPCGGVEIYQVAFQAWCRPGAAFHSDYVQRHAGGIRGHLSTPFVRRDPSGPVLALPASEGISAPRLAIPGRTEALALFDAVVDAQFALFAHISSDGLEPALRAKQDDGRATMVRAHASLKAANRRMFDERGGA